MSRRDISLGIHNSLLDSANTIRGALGLSPKKDYGCAYDRIEDAKRRQIEASYQYTYEDNDSHSLYDEESSRRDEDEESYEEFIDFLNRF